MKSYKIIFTMLVAAIFASCEQLVEPEFSSENSMTTIECIVVKEAKLNANGSKPEDVTEKFAGSIASNGIITFSGISALTDDQKKQARFTAIVPLTATIVEKDGAGNVIGNGIGGLRILTKKTYYFYVVAANGAERKYVITFN
jgi:hypothetical protein